MRPDPDVLVVGGGIVGLFCAYHLRATGRTVALVERTEVGDARSCSSGNTGFVGTQGAAPLAEPAVLAAGLRRLLSPDSPLYLRPRWDAELLRWVRAFRRACTEEAARAGFRVLLDMKRRSLAILRELCSSGRLAPTFTAPGMVIAYRTAEAYAQAVRAVPDAVAGGVPLRVLDRDELRALEPDTEFAVAGALFNGEGAYLRVPEFLRELAGLLAGQGVEIHNRTDVRGFEVAGGAVTRVRTDRGDLRPAEVVIAAGSWSPACTRLLGIPLLLQPAKGYAVTVEAPPTGPRLPVVLAEGRVAVAPLGDRLRFAGTLELAGLDRGVSARRVDGLRRTVGSYLPQLAGAGPVEVWTGLRPCTPDSLPFLGRAGAYRNVTVACGHGHIGMGLAPVTGRLVAQVVAGEPPELDLTPLRVGRYDRRRDRG